MEVTPAQFEALYALPVEYWVLNTRFRESRRYFYMDHYAWGMKAWPEREQTWRVRRREMPADFPGDERVRFTGFPLDAEQQAYLDAAVRRARSLGLDVTVRGTVDFPAGLPGTWSLDWVPN